MSESPVTGSQVGGIAHKFRNLVGVPSYHYDPIFAQSVREIFEHTRPSVVALELPPTVESELIHASQCWPTPVASRASDGTTFPFVPGDSIFEAFLLALEAKLPIVLVDADIASFGYAAYEVEACVPVGGELATRLGTAFVDLVDVSAPVDFVHPRDRAREACMAYLLDRLMREHDHVLWVGGAAHWTRIIDRIDKSDFMAPEVEFIKERSFERFHLHWSALLKMTGRAPHLCSRYASDPDLYREAQVLRQAGLAALGVGAEINGSVIVSDPGRYDAARDPINLARESGTPLDVSRVLLYARNLALTTGFRDRPNFYELVTSALATIGSRYASRLASILLAEDSTGPCRDLPELAYGVGSQPEEFCSCGRPITIKQWVQMPPFSTGPPLRIVPGRAEKEWLPPEDLIGRGGTDRGDDGIGEDVRYWGCYPSDEVEFERFIEYVLRRASVWDPTVTLSHPFLSGMCDGIDVRETIAHWQRDELYVREQQRTRVDFRNGVIDWTNEQEQTPLLRGEVSGGWIDPDCRHVGSCSFEPDFGEEIQGEPYRVQIDSRHFSAISLDYPTMVPWSGTKRESFFQRVIRPLVDIKHTDQHNIYGWLDIIFRSATGKPFVYYSQYVPSGKIYELARAHHIQLLHIPLRQIPAPLLARHQRFRFMEMKAEQWIALREQLEAQGLWDMAAILRLHEEPEN